MFLILGELQKLFLLGERGEGRSPAHHPTGRSLDIPPWKFDRICFPGRLEADFERPDAELLGGRWIEMMDTCSNIDGCLLQVLGIIAEEVLAAAP